MESGLYFCLNKTIFFSDTWQNRFFYSVQTKGHVQIVKKNTYYRIDDAWLQI